MLFTSSLHHHPQFCAVKLGHLNGDGRLVRQCITWPMPYQSKHRFRQRALHCKAELHEAPKVEVEGYKKYPIVGYLPSFRKDPAIFMLKFQQAVTDQGLEAAFLDFGPLGFIYVHSPRQLQHLLSDNGRNYYKSDLDRRGVGLLVGNGILLNDGEPHLQRRRLVMQCFTLDRLNGFVGRMNQIAAEGVAQLMQETQDKHVAEIDAKEMCSQAALRIIGQCGFSTELGQSSMAVGAALDSASRYVIKVTRSVWYPPLFIPIPSNQQYKRDLAVLDDLVYGIIRQRKQQLQQQDVKVAPSGAVSAAGSGAVSTADAVLDDSTSVLNGLQQSNRQAARNGQQQQGGPGRGLGAPSRAPPDLLDLLLAARFEDGEGLSDQELRDEVMTLVLAGHETSANVLTWALTYLAKHPQALQCAQQEVQELVQNTPNVLQNGVLRIGVREMERLPFVEAVLKESMRLRPPGWALDRQAVADDVLPGGTKVKAGAILLVSPWCLHHKTDVFEDVEAFKPERFLPGGRAANLGKYEYIPFSAGGRSCIGNNFAMYEMKILMAHWLYHFDFQLLSEWPVPVEASITMRPNAPIILGVTPQTVGVAAGISV